MPLLRPTVAELLAVVTAWSSTAILTMPRFSLAYFATVSKGELDAVLQGTTRHNRSEIYPKADKRLRNLGADSGKHHPSP